MQGVVRVAKFLHKKKIVHRDLKLENILVEEKSLRVKVIDFAFSTDVPHPGLL
jgi:serine/threonine protein kinase